MTEKVEVWLPIEGWQYDVSSLGRVRRINKAGAPGRVLKPSTNSRGYDQLSLYRRGSRRPICVHILVAETFHGPRPPGMQVNHIDGIKGNNRPGNLEYVSPGGNTRHAFAMGLLGRGETHHLSKLTAQEVLEIRARKSSGEMGAELAREYGTSRSNISTIAARRSWKSLP